MPAQIVYLIWTEVLARLLKDSALRFGVFFPLASAKACDTSIFLVSISVAYGCHSVFLLFVLV